MVRLSSQWLVGIIFLAPASPAFAGAWTQPEGHGQAALTGVWSTATQGFDGSGSLQPTAHTEKFELQGLFEYGATDRFTVMAMPILRHIRIGPPVNASSDGFGSIELGGRYRLLRGPSWVFSGQATVLTRGEPEPITPAAIGNSGVEGDVRALFGYSTSLGAWPSFVDLQLAQRFRSGDAPNEARFDATFGITPLPRWAVWAQSFNVFAEGSTALFPNYSYHKLQLSVIYDITPAWAVQLGGYSTFAGRNALQENGVLLGAWYHF